MRRPAWGALLAVALLAGRAIAEGDQDAQEDIYSWSIQYFLAKHVQTVLHFGCGHLDAARYLLTASAAGQRTRVVSSDQSQDVADSHVRAGFSRLGLFLDASCDSLDAVLAQASDLQLFNASFHWFVWSPLEYGEKLLLALERSYLAVNSELVVCWPSQNVTNRTNLSLQFWDVHKLRHGGEVLLERIQQEQTLPFWSSNTLRRRKDLSGYPIVGIVAVMRGMKPGWDQEAEFLDTRRGPNDPNIYQRESAHILVLLRELYNFTFRLKTAAVGGAYLKNGSCTGVSGQLQRGEADYGLFLRMELPRWSCVDYIYDTFKFTEIVMIHRLPPESSATTGMVRPFSGRVWLALGVTAVLLWAFLWLVRPPADNPAGSGSPMLLTVGVVANASAQLEMLSPRPSARSAYYIAMLGFFVLAAFYSSAIISALVVRDTRGGLPMRGIIKEGFQIIAEDYILYRVFFRNYTTDPFLKELAHRFLTPSAYIKLPTALQMVRAGKVALITDKNTVVSQLEGKVMTETEMCSLRFTRVSKFLNMAVSSKNWPLRDLAARGLALIRERGVGRRVSPVIVPPCTGPDADANNGKEVAQLPVAACFVAFAILSVGVFASFFLFLVELCAGWWQRLAVEPGRTTSNVLADLRRFVLLPASTKKKFHGNKV